MSFILDALKKSEAERQRQAGPALLEMRVLPPQRRLPLWAITVGVLLIVNVLVLSWLALRPSSPGAATVAAGGAAAPAAAPAVATTPATGAGAAATGGNPSTAPPGGAATSGGTAAASGASAPSAAMAGLPATPANAAAPGAGGFGTTGGADNADDNPADVEPAVAPPPAALPAGRDAVNLRNYAELSGHLPELRLDLHVFAANPSDRYAFINMHKVREGDVTAEGVKVLQITHDGVVLDYRGTEFLLGRE